MNTPLMVAAAALAVALVALASARRSLRQVAQLTDLYWRLKYEHGELKSKVAPAPPEPPAPVSAFVPLSQVKRPDPSP